MTVSFSVAENAERGSIIGQIDISDLDHLDKGKLKLQLLSQKATSKLRFGIDNAGRIYTTDQLDREVEANYHFDIVATDSIKPFHTAKVIYLTPRPFKLTNF